MLPSLAAAPNITLNNGVQMPILAFGANVWDAGTCESATTSALNEGFRFVWSSQLIGQDCQSAQGKAIAASTVARKELFIAGTADTASCTSHDDCYQQTKAATEQQFQLLVGSGGALDMLMLDYPPYTQGCDLITGQWRAFEEVYAAKRVRTIAVSNFLTDQIKCITANASATVPSVNQLDYSVGKSSAIIDANAQLGVVVQAYSPLGSGGLISAPLLQTIGKSHNKSSAQVALRWIVQHNATVNTQSTNPSHLHDDADIFDFVLTPPEMAQLDAYQP